MSRPFRLLAMTAASAALASSSPDSGDITRAKKLQEYLQKEKPRFEERENQRKGLIEELDRLNLGQNNVRQRIAAITMNHAELTMALDNMKVEIEKQKQQEVLYKERLVQLMKFAHKIRKEGVLRFLVNGEDLGSVANRVRILFRTLRTHGNMTRELKDKSVRLAESEQRLGASSSEVQKLLTELRAQERVLDGLLEKKRKLVKSLNQKQNDFQASMKQYRVISKQVSTLFDNFESIREGEGYFPNRKTLPIPVEFGKVVKNFGRSVHETFGTVTYQKGIEIEAEHNTPVHAILPGVVEYDGWVKGLGNVIIVHHGGGFYSLSAHLFKSSKPIGSKVQQGETIGLVGDTGNSDKPSLYFEIRENGKAVDPLMYFSPKALASLQ